MRKKLCLSCEKLRSFKKFFKRAVSSDGRGFICRSCYAKGRKRSKAGKAAAYSWDRMVGRIRHYGGTKSYGHVEIRMTKTEFFIWAVPKFREWFEQYPKIKPSIDRIKNSGHYELSNIQMIPHQTNCGKTSRSINNKLPEGYKHCGRCKDDLPFKAFKPVKPGATGTFGLFGWCIECSREYERNRPPRNRK